MSVLVIVVSAAAFSVFGVISRSSDGELTQMVQPTVRLTIPAAARMSPLNDYLMSSLAPFDEFEAIENEISVCMAARGWTYRPIPVDRELVVEDPQTVGELQVYSARYGYGMATVQLLIHQGEMSSRLDDPNDEHVGELSLDDQRRYYVDREGSYEGEPSVAQRAGSCRGLAETKVHAGIPFFDPVVQPTVPELIAAINEEPAVVEALSGWRWCMRLRGYRFADPERHAHGSLRVWRLLMIWRLSHRTSVTSPWLTLSAQWCVCSERVRLLKSDWSESWRRRRPRGGASV